MQEDLKKLSTRSRRIVAKNCSHYIVLDRPDLIEKEVPVFMEQIRGATPQPATYGSTETEQGDAPHAKTSGLHPFRQSDTCHVMHASTHATEPISSLLRRIEDH
jgi:hypothetical protein